MQANLLFPNPFTPIRIDGILDADAKITLEILDENGKVIFTRIVQKPYAIDLRSLELEDRGWSTGKYYRVSATSQGKALIVTRKMISLSNA